MKQGKVIVRRTKESYRDACPLDCHQRQVHQRLQRQARNLLQPGLQLSLQPLDRVLVLSFSPRISLIDLISLLFYSASFWISFCPASLLLGRRIRRMMLPKQRRSNRHGLRWAVLAANSHVLESPLHPLQAASRWRQVAAKRAIH